MSEDNITAPSNESHQLQAPGLAFDCAGIIKQVIEHTSARHDNTMVTIANTMENQQQQNEQNYRYSSWNITVFGAKKLDSKYSQ